MAPDTASLVASILNAAWMVRHYARCSSRFERDARAKAIRELGLTVRRAFTVSEDFEPLLAAVCDGLKPKDERPF